MFYREDTFFDKLRRKYLNKSEKGTFREWYDWENQAKEKHSMLYCILETIPMKISRLCYIISGWVKEIAAKYYHKTHVITVDVNRFPLNWSNSTRKYWRYDGSDKMLYISFQLLVDIYEMAGHERIILRQEQYLDCYEGWSELEVLYKWWIEARPKRDKSWPKVTDFGLSGNFWGIDENGIDNMDKPGMKLYNKAMDEVDKREKRYKKIDDEMLERLIANRSCLRY